MKDNCEILHEETYEFEFEDFLIIYNRTLGVWVVSYYDSNGDEQEEIFSSVDEIPEELNFSEADFNNLKAHLQKEGVLE